MSLNPPPPIVSLVIKGGNAEGENIYPFKPFENK